MKKIGLEKTLIIFGILGLICVLIFMTFEKQALSLVQISSDNTAPEGYDFFVKESKKRADQQTDFLKRSIQGINDLSGYQTLMILSPLRPLSRYEGEIILKFASAGGTVLLSFHDENTFTNIYQVLRHFSSNLSIEKSSRYAKGEVTAVQALAAPFDFATEYHFYSAFELQGRSCYVAPCLFLNFPAEKGKVLLFAGLPPFANGLLHRSNNSDFAVQLLDQLGNTLIDTFHLAHSSVSWFDLLLDLQIMTPLMTLLFGVLGFLFFGFLRGEESQSELLSKPSKTHHDLNIEMFLYSLKKTSTASEAAQFQAAEIIRLFPEKAVEIKALLGSHQNVKEITLLSQKLIGLHRKFILERSNYGRTKSHSNAL